MPYNFLKILEHLKKLNRMYHQDNQLISINQTVLILKLDRIYHLRIDRRYNLVKNFINLNKYKIFYDIIGRFKP